MSGHRSASGWWPECVTLRIERFESLDALTLAEKTAIENENPKYNLAGATTPYIPRKNRTPEETVRWKRDQVNRTMRFAPTWALEMYREQLIKIYSEVPWNRMHMWNALVREWRWLYYEALKEAPEDVERVPSAGPMLWTEDDWSLPWLETASCAVS